MIINYIYCLANKQSLMIYHPYENVRNHTYALRHLQYLLQSLQSKFTRISAPQDFQNNWSWIVVARTHCAVNQFA